MSKRRSRLSVHQRDWTLEERLAPVTQLLPDLFVHSSFLTGWYVNPLPGGGQEIRFATALANGGGGAFELNGTTTYITNPDGTQSQVVNQRIYQDDGTSILRPAGTFYYDEYCADMHFDEMSLGRILLRPNGNGVGGVVASGEKDGFCLIDSTRYDGSLPGSPATAKYKSCGAQVQGISVGWTDVYSSVIDGQSIDITGLPNGDYWLEVISDPSNHILENNESNNSTRVAITLTSQPTYGFRVLNVNPIWAVDGPVSSATLTFNQAVNVSSFNPSSYQLTGPAGFVPINSVVAIDETNLRVNFPTQTQVGTYTMTQLPNVLNTVGQKLDQNNNGTGGESSDALSFVFTIPAPKILVSYPHTGVAGPVSKVRVRYNKPITSSTVGIADIVSFTGPGGVNLLNSITSVVPAATTGTSASFDIFFDAVTAAGLYHMVIGPNVTDPLGHTTDQNLDDTTTAADNYLASFAVSAPGTIGPDEFGYTAISFASPTPSIVGRPGNFTIANGADDAALAVNLGNNTFSFFGASYAGADNLWVSTNGLITLGANAGNYAFLNDDLRNTEIATLAVLWDDWAAGSGNPQLLGLFEDTNGDSVPDRLIIEWNQVKHTSPGPSDTGVSFQAVLELNTGARAGTITYNYLDLDASNSSYSNGASATVGARAPGEYGSRMLVSFNSATNPLVQTGKAIQFSVPRVQSITRLDASPNGAGEGRFQVTFSDGVTGVEKSDFVLTKTGTIVGEWIDSVSPTADARVWNVHFQWFKGSGTLGLTVLDDDSIRNLFGARLGGLGIGGGQFNQSPGYSLTEPAQQRLVVGADAGGGPHVRVIKASSGQEVFSFFAFDAGFRGGVRVAQGDVNSDGTPDILVAAGPGGGPHVKVFDGRDLHLLANFYAYGASFQSGVWIASGDVNHDGRDDIITGADSGGGPHVRVFSGATGGELLSFFAYGAGFNGGVRVGAGDVNGDGHDDIITGAGPGGGPHVKVFSGANGSVLRSFYAYDAGFRGGVFVAGGDCDGDLKADIVTGAGAGGGPHVKVFSSTGVMIQSLFAFQPTATLAGVRVGCADINGDGRADVLAAAGIGDQPVIDCRDATNSNQIKKLFGFDPSFLGGVYVGG